MKAKKRIECIVNEICEISKSYNEKQNLVLLDVGTDHGMVAYDAIKNGCVTNVICSDISEKSLQKAIKVFEFDGKFDKSADFRVGDGLHVIGQNEKIDICVIAGMGSHEIVKILLESEHKLDNVKFFIFQTATDDEALVSVLNKLGFDFLFDKFIFDAGHVYRTITVCKFSNCTRQSGIHCDKLHSRKMIGEEELKNLNIDPIYFGKDNLVCHSSQHILALEKKREQIQRLNSVLESAMAKMTIDGTLTKDYIDYVESRAKLEVMINKIVEWCQRL